MSIFAKSTLIILLSINAFQTFGVQAEGTKRTCFTTYGVRDLGIVIEYPSNWTRIDYGQEKPREPSNIVSFTPPKQKVTPLPFFNIQVVNVTSENRSLIQNVHQQTQDLRQNFLDFKLLELKSTMLASYHAYKIVYTFQMPYLLEEYKSTEIWMINNNILYIISFNSENRHYTKYIPVVEKIANSFRLANTCQ